MGKKTVCRGIKYARMFSTHFCKVTVSVRQREDREGKDRMIASRYNDWGSREVNVFYVDADPFKYLIMRSRFWCSAVSA